jgi:hypothetical protein
MDFVDERPEVVINLAGSLACAEVVAARVQDDGTRSIGDDDPIGEISRVGNLRSAETTIDHVVTWKIVRQAFPKSNAGRPDKQHRARRRRRLLVGRLECADRLFPFRTGRRVSSPNATDHDDRQADDKRSAERAAEHGNFL